MIFNWHINKEYVVKLLLNEQSFNHYLIIPIAF